MSKDKHKNKTEEVTKIQYVPYENYITRILMELHKKFEKMAADMDIIKERITFDYKDDKK